MDCVYTHLFRELKKDELHWHTQQLKKEEWSW